MTSTRYPLPIFLNIVDKHCLVVGGGNVAFRKAQDLVECGAAVTVVAEQTVPELARMAEEGTLSLHVRSFEDGDADGAFLVYAATDNEVVNSQVETAAREYGAIINVVDVPARCDFFSGAVVKRGPLRVAVSTSGCCPAAAADIRSMLEGIFDESYGDYLTAAAELRADLLANRSRPRTDEALKWLGSREALDIFRSSGKQALWDAVTNIISS